MIPQQVVEYCRVRARWGGFWEEGVVLEINGHLGIMRGIDNMIWGPLEEADEVIYLAPPVLRDGKVDPFPLAFWQCIHCWPDLV